MEHITQKASYNLTKLHRFKSAPPNIKLTLYKTLIRPIFEYPSILLADTSDTRIHKLQLIQNKALRFIYNTHWSDYITNTSLHNRAKIETVKDRLENLKTKTLLRAYDTITDDQGRNAVYIYSDYVIEEDPCYNPSNKLREVYNGFGILDQLSVLTQ